MVVQDVLKSKTGGVIVIREDATVAEAVGLLVAHNIGSLPVLDAAGALVGIFSERDLLRGVHSARASYLDQPIAQAMTPDPHTCSPSDNVHDAMGKMSGVKVGQLPVVAEGEVVGLLSSGDVVRFLHDSVSEENRHLTSYLHGTY